MPDFEGCGGGGRGCEECKRVGITDREGPRATAEDRQRDPRAGFQPQNPRQVVSAGAYHHPLWPGRERAASFLPWVA
eukprot:6212596-Pleurochrysis_carterae.AAC.5